MGRLGSHKVTPENLKRALWVDVGLEPQPQFHERTPNGGRKDRNLRWERKKSAKSRAVPPFGPPPPTSGPQLALAQCGHRQIRFAQMRSRPVAPCARLVRSPDAPQFGILSSMSSPRESLIASVASLALALEDDDPSGGTTLAITLLQYRTCSWRDLRRSGSGSEDDRSSSASFWDDWLSTVQSLSH